MTSSLSEKIKDKINQRFDQLIMKCESGKVKTACCLVCDKYLKNTEKCFIRVDLLMKNMHNLKADNWNMVSEELGNCYCLPCPNLLPEGEVDSLQQLLLSPRAVVVLAENEEPKYTCCRTCLYNLQRIQMPPYAIANNYCFGNPPCCLEELNEVELALLTPVKAYGYVFCYTGGLQKQLKGFLSYYRVNIESIVETVTHFDLIGLTENIGIFYFGNMTKQQKERARKRSMIRPNKVIDAMRWLLIHNSEWSSRNIDLTMVRNKLMTYRPVIYDNCVEVSSRNNDNDTSGCNIESTESFQVFFPDGRMSSTTGGQLRIEEFKELIREATQNGFDLELKANLMKEAVSDYKDNNLINSCLLQFPFGRGGMHEKR